MDQCDSLITELITVLLDWYSGDIYGTGLLPQKRMQVKLEKEKKYHNF